MEDNLHCLEIQAEFSLHDVIRRVRDGDTESFGLIVAKYQTRLRSYMLTRAPNSNHAEDLAQNTFITAFEMLDKFAPNRDFEAWLFGIARNLVRREWDNAGREERHRPPILELLKTRLAERATADTPAQPSRLIEALRNCIGRLTERKHEIVKLHYENRDTIAEIALKMGNQPATVGATLFQIREQLRDCIKMRLDKSGETDNE